MSKKIMLLSLGSLAVATAVAVPVAVVLSGDSAKATTTGGAGTTPTPTTTGEAGKTGTTGDGAETPLKSTVPKLVSRHFDTAAEFNKHPFVTDVEIAKDGTEKDIVDQKGDFGRNEFIFAGGTKELAYLLGTSTLEELSETTFSFLKQMENTIVETIKANKVSNGFIDADNAITANENLENSNKPIDDSAVVSVNLAKANGSINADSIVININHASWSDAKKILKAAKIYFEKHTKDAMAKLKYRTIFDKSRSISVTEYAEITAKFQEKETITILEGLFNRLINSI